MKTRLFFSICLAFIFSSNIFAQTDGALTLSYTVPVPTSPAPWTGAPTNTNLVAAWISDSSDNFVRAIFVYTGQKDHLSTFAQKAGCAFVTTSTPNYYNAKDAVTATCVTNKQKAMVPGVGTSFVSGATRTDSTSPTGFGTLSLTWDGKDNNGVTVADGSYKINVEMSWSTTVTRNGHDEFLVIPFTKGATITTNSVTDTYVTASSAKWTPAALATDDVTSRYEFKIFPNPVKDNFSIRTLENVKSVNVFDASGRVVKSYSKADNYNISTLKPGTYYLQINTESGVAYDKIIKK